MPALEFKWRLVAQEYHASATGPGRRRAVEAYLQSLAGWIGHGVIDSIQMGLLVNQLSMVLSLPGEEVFAQLVRLSRRELSRPGKGVAAGPVRPVVDAEQEAIRQILEVLLNEPSHYPSVRPYLDPARIRSPELALVAQHLVELLERGEPFVLSDLIGRFELPAFGQLITDLQDRGERRGRYPEVIAGAIRCLESAARARQTALLAGTLRGGSADAATAGQSEEERLLALAASARNPHFSSPRARRKYLAP